MKTQSLHLVFMLCLLASLCNAQLPSYLPTNGLVAWYPFNGNANDESGNGNNGEVNGAVTSIDRLGNNNSAYNFNGSSDYISISHNTSLNFNQYTISVWSKIDLNFNWATLGGVIISKGCEQFNESGNSFRIYFEGTYYTVDNWAPERAFLHNLSNNLDNNWAHIVFLYNAESILMYINGVLLGSVTQDSNLVQNTDPLIIGARRYGPSCSYGYSFAGTIDDIAIYNRALTQAEVTALYTATATNTGGGTTTSTTAPPGIPYQAEVRNESGEVLANANVNVRFTLHELAANGSVSYQETHALTTNELGLFAATIGAGTATQGTFASINWALTTKFLQVEVDTGSGWITMGNQQLMSVPYAMYAANSQPGPAGPEGAQGPAGEQGPSGSSGLTSLINVSNTLPDSNCPQGGIKIETGLDYNINNILDSTEINSIQTKTICFPNETNSNLSNLIFGSRNISANSELNNAVTIVSESGNGIWCCGPTHTVPAGKLWKIAGYSGAVSSGLLTGETWLDEGQSITFQGNSNNGGSIPYSFTAFEYTKSELDFSVVSNYGTGIWCCGPSFTVPSGKIWKVVGYSGAVNSGIMNGETWLDEGQSLTFQGNSNNGGGIPFRFIAFEYSK
jgi:hypothetical protein